MTEQDNIRWYWGDLSPREQVYMLSELYITLTDKQKDEFLKMTDNK